MGFPQIQVARDQVRVLVVAAVRLYRDGLAAALDSRTPVVVVGVAGTRVEARASVLALCPDVILIDVAVRHALDLIRDLRRDAPHSGIIAFAVDEVSSDIVECAKAGAAGYVTAEASMDDLVDAIQRAVSGELVCSPRIAGELFRRLADSGPGSLPGQPLLTGRERQVLHLIREGLSNKEIAQTLNIAESTVKNHVHHLLAKLDVPTRTRAAACAGSAVGHLARTLP